MRPFVAFTGLLLLGSLASALTVDEAVNQAQTHNLGLAIEDLRLAQKADEKAFGFNRLYPSVSVSAALARLDSVAFPIPEALWPAVANINPTTRQPYVSYPGKALTEDNHWNLAIGLNVQFVWSPAVFRGIAQTVVDYDNAQLSRASASARLERDVRKAFAQLLALREATSLFEAQLKVAEDRWKLARVNFEAGLGSEIALLQAQVAYENRKPLVADQRLNEESARAAFRILLNLPDGADLALVGDLTVLEDTKAAVRALDAEVLVRAHLDGRFDVATAEGAVKSLRNLVALQADTLLPSVVLSYSADPSVNAPLVDSRWLDPSLYAQRSGAFSVGLAWKLDGLLPGSTAGIELAGRTRQAEQAQRGVEQARRAAEVEIRTLVGRLKKSASSLDGLSLALSLAQRSAKLTEAGYRAGNQSFTDAQDADLALQTARLQFLNEELALTSTLADLAYALGARSHG